MDWLKAVGSRVARRIAGEKRRLRLITLGTSLLLAFGLLFLVFSIEVSSTPQFCGSCHIMEPYYNSWVSSSHGSIACVECHIPPGITAEFRKKYEALSMVARYFTGTYGTNPWTEVDDSACLRCHERRLIQGREVFHNALFDHRPHLAEVRRGMKLRCTSCHSQIVQGDHISVTVTTCILCHFKNETVGEGPADCTVCHEVPGHVVTAGNLEFDHGDVGRFGMRCLWCHEHVAEGTGNVPRERCSTWHHHVTDHKVDCGDCHLEILHNAQPEVASRDSDCQRCHSTGSHSPQNDLYAGIGARGVRPMPSPMFAAGVRCEGCHLEGSAAVPASVSEASSPHVARANEVSCMACHGPGYYSIYLGWKEAAASRVAALAEQMRATERALGKRGGAAWDDALWNFGLVQRGNGIHNVTYAAAVLSRAHAQMNEARAAAGLSALEEPWPSATAGSAGCLSCHVGIEEQEGRFEGISFAHRRHVQDGALDCSACHRPHEERERDEMVRFGREGCSSCHHQEVKADCLTCHGNIRQREIEVDLGSFSHAFHLDEVELACSDCHSSGGHGAFSLDRDTCAGCHE
jgi:nitrate/TMAO reductase-like tetraheme cytochrome c subunit